MSHTVIKLARTAVFLPAFLLGCAQQQVPPPINLVADPPPRSGDHDLGARSSDLDRGIAYLKSNAFGQALPYFQRVVAAHPNDAQSTYYLALCFDQLGKRSEAVEAYKQAIVLDAKLVEPRMNLAAIYLEKPMRPRRAIEVLVPAAKLEPKANDVHSNLAFAYRLVKNYAKSEEHYRAALAIKDDMKERVVFADMLHEAKRYQAMAEQQRLVLDFVKNDTQTLVAMAHRFGRARAYRDCVKAFSLAIDKLPKKAALHVNRGLCYHGLRDEVNARADYTKVLELKPHLPVAHYYMGLSFLDSGKKGQARIQLQLAIKHGKDSKVGERATKKLIEMNNASRKR